ncbi:MAG: HDOD domain-containing protein [Solirubrobacterales bacterium]|nr:HDOD domain-containing protein [Solirubrobacterales bacterium]
MAATSTEPRSVAVARQPICDARGRVKAYELLYRGAARDVTGAQATAHVLVSAFADIGLSALVGGRPAFVNVDAPFLLAGDLPFSPDAVCLELLEDQDPTPELLARLRELTAQGFALALDDFAFRPGTEPLLELATIVKVDLRAGDEGHAARQRELLAPFDVTLLAEKVEDEAEFERCRDLGYELFQGYWFCRPVLVCGREIPAASQAALHAGAVLSRSDVSFEELEELISGDPGLSLRLLRLVNSASYARRSRIGTVREALTMLGARTVRQWAMLLVLAGLETRCDELVPTALARARTLALVADERSLDPDVAFAVGLFSVADALLGVPMDEALGGLPLVDEVLAALVERRGALGEALSAVLAHEHGEPAGEGVAERYVEALAWTEERFRLTRAV